MCYQQRLTLVERSPLRTREDRALGVRFGSDWIPCGPPPKRLPGGTKVARRAVLESGQHRAQFVEVGVRIARLAQSIRWAQSAAPQGRGRWIGNADMSAVLLLCFVLPFLVLFRFCN
jgi:hypothetical protein